MRDRMKLEMRRDGRHSDEHKQPKHNIDNELKEHDINGNSGSRMVAVS